MRVEGIHIYWDGSLDSQPCCHFSTGSIVIQKDRWLEGFILDTSFTKDREKSNTGFIFGLYVNTEILDLFYGRETTIIRFYGCREDSSYKGKSYLVGPYQEKQNGTCEIRTFRNSLYDEEQTNNRISLVKSTLSSNVADYYEEIFKKRDQIVVYEGHNGRVLEKISDIGVHMQPSKNQQGKSKKYKLFSLDSRKNFDDYV